MVTSLKSVVVSGGSVVVVVVVVVEMVVVLSRPPKIALTGFRGRLNNDEILNEGSVSSSDLSLFSNAGILMSGNFAMGLKNGGRARFGVELTGISSVVEGGDEGSKAGVSVTSSVRASSSSNGCTLGRS